jgi:prepilin-type N-terminal cleavage/methylation domain-containing protein
MSFKKEKKMTKQEGFTLLELLVVIALMMIIYAMTLTNYNGLNKNIDVQNTAYDVALAIRETQLYGINKKLVSGEFSDGNPFPFGFHLDLANDDTKKKV